VEPDSTVRVEPAPDGESLDLAAGPE
jgi:hypothetical protein